MKAQNVLQTIGNTPHIRINKLFGANANVWIKSERSNPGGSVKDRIALAMVEDAEKRVLSKRAAPSLSPPLATRALVWPWWLLSRATN